MARRVDATAGPCVASHASLSARCYGAACKARRGGGRHGSDLAVTGNGKQAAAVQSQCCRNEAVLVLVTPESRAGGVGWGAEPRFAFVTACGDIEYIATMWAGNFLIASSLFSFGGFLNSRARAGFLLESLGNARAHKRHGRKGIPRPEKSTLNLLRTRTGPAPAALISPRPPLPCPASAHRRSLEPTVLLPGAPHLSRQTRTLRLTPNQRPFFQEA